MTLFRKNPDDALAKARADLAKTEQMIAEQRVQRGRRLVEADDVTSVAAIDAAIEANQRAVGILRDRIVALEEECRRQETEKREQQRHAAIARIAQKLKHREAKAVELESAIHRVVALFASVTAAGDLRDDWPFSMAMGLPPDNEAVARGVLLLLHKTARASAGQTDLFSHDFWPALNRGTGSEDIKGRIAAHHEWLLKMLRTMPLPGPEAADDDKEIAA